MIKNIVFDLGGVLVNFMPEKYLRHIGFDESEIDFLTNLIFYGKEWYEYNSSKYTIKQTAENLMKKYPQYEDKIKKIFDNLDYTYILFEMSETTTYLKELKNNGYNIFILSDLSIDSYSYNKEFELFNYIDGGVYSFEIGSTKPNDNNYKTLLEKYKLIPNETIFIDDKFENINAANKFGINGVQFTTLNEVKQKISLLIESSNKIR